VAAHAQHEPTPAQVKKLLDRVMLLILCLTALAVAFHSARGDGTVIVGLTTVVYTVAAAFIGVMLLHYRRSKRRPVWLAIVCPALSIAVMLSVAFTQWPLRASYAVSRDGLNRLAARIDAGQQVATPKRVGLFVIRAADVSRDGIVELWTDDSAIGRRGFVHCRPDRAPGNLWSMIQLDDSWLFVEED
jgi:amino acid transporter